MTYPLDAQFTENPLKAVGPVLVLLVGFVVVAHPLYIWPHYGQTAHVLIVQQDTGQPESFIEYETLPPDAQAAFREALSEGQYTLWSGEDDRVIDRFQGGLLIEYNGSYYRAGIQTGVTIDFQETILRWFGTAIGGLLLAFGGLVLYSGSWRPLTPLRSLFVTAVVTAAFLATNAYDVLYSGVEGPVLGIAGLGIIELIPVTTLFLGVGSEVARNGPTSTTAIGGTVGIVLLGIIIPNPEAVQVILGLVAVIGGLPWFGLGYRLTNDA